MHRFLPVLGLLTLAPVLVADEPPAEDTAAQTRAAISRGFTYSPPPSAVPAAVSADTSAPATVALPDIVVFGRKERRDQELEVAIARKKQTESKALFKNDESKSIRVEALLPPETEGAGPPATRDNPAAKIGNRLILPILRFSW